MAKTERAAPLRWYVDADVVTPAGSRAHQEFRFDEEEHGTILTVGDALRLAHREARRKGIELVRTKQVRWYVVGPNGEVRRDDGRNGYVEGR